MRRTLLLAAGLLAYFFGATARVYLRHDDPCGSRGSRCDGRRAVADDAGRTRGALGRTPLATKFLVTADQPE